MHVVHWEKWNSENKTHMYIKKSKYIYSVFKVLITCFSSIHKVYVITYVINFILDTKQLHVLSFMV